MKVVMNVGLVKETEKAMLVSFWTASNIKGFRAGQKYEVITAWVPKSQVEVVRTFDHFSSFNTYHNLKSNHMGLISEGTVKRNRVSKAMTVMIPNWLYKKSMTYGFNI